MAIQTTTLLLALLASTTVYGYSGDMTFYAPGLGACGQYHGASDWIVAMNSPQFDADKPCGRQVCLEYQGKTQTATVVDRCAGCAYGLIDASPSLFNAMVGGPDAGKVRINWNYGACGGRNNNKEEEDRKKKEQKDKEDAEEEAKKARERAQEEEAKRKEREEKAQEDKAKDEAREARRAADSSSPTQAPSVAIADIPAADIPAADTTLAKTVSATAATATVTATATVSSTSVPSPVTPLLQRRSCYQASKNPSRRRR